MLALQYDRANDQHIGDQISNSPMVDMANPGDIQSVFRPSDSQSRPNVVDSGQLVFDNPYARSDGKILIGPGNDPTPDSTTEPLSKGMFPQGGDNPDPGSTDARSVKPLCDSTTTGTSSNGGTTTDQGTGTNTNLDQQILNQFQQVEQGFQQLTTEINQALGSSGSSSGSGDSTAGGISSSSGANTSATYNPANDAALQNLSNTGDSQLQQTLTSAWADVQNGTLSQSAYSQFENASIPLTTPANDPAGVPFNTDSTLEQAALSSIAPNLSQSDLATLQGLINPQTPSSSDSGSSTSGSSSSDAGGSSSGNSSSDSGGSSSSCSNSGGSSGSCDGGDSGSSDGSSTSGGSSLDQQILAQLQSLEQEVQTLSTDLNQLLAGSGDGSSGSSDGSSGSGDGSSGTTSGGSDSTYNPADDAALQNLSNTGDSQLQQTLLNAWADVQNGTLSQSAYSQFENAAIPLTTPANDPGGVPFQTDSTLEQAALSSVQSNLSTGDVATLQGLINPSQTAPASPTTAALSQPVHTSLTH